MTLSGVIGPLTDVVERFIIGAAASVSALAFYATPFMILTNLWIVPTALTGVLFPAFAAGLEAQRERTVRLYRRSMDWVFVALLPFVFITFAFANRALTIWIDSSFAENATTVLQILAIGFLLNAVAQVPFAMLQAAGRPDLLAKVNIVELPLYLAVIVWAIQIYGIAGVAAAWTLRTGLNLAVLLVLTRRTLRTGRAINYKPVLVRFGAVLLLVLSTMVPDLWPRIFYTAIALAILASAAWMYVLDPEDRSGIRTLVRSRGRLFVHDEG